MCHFKETIIYHRKTLPKGMLNDNQKPIAGSISLANNSQISFIILPQRKLHKNYMKCQKRLIHVFV